MEPLELFLSVAPPHLLEKIFAEISTNLKEASIEVSDPQLQSIETALDYCVERHSEYNHGRFFGMRFSITQVIQSYREQL